MAWTMEEFAKLDLTKVTMSADPPDDEEYIDIGIDLDPWSRFDFSDLDLPTPTIGPLTPLGVKILEQRKLAGLCPACGAKGAYVNFAPVCDEHGPY